MDIYKEHVMRLLLHKANGEEEWPVSLLKRYTSSSETSVPGWWY